MALGGTAGKREREGIFTLSAAVLIIRSLLVTSLEWEPSRRATSQPGSELLHSGGDFPAIFHVGEQPSSKGSNIFTDKCPTTEEV